MREPQQIRKTLYFRRRVPARFFGPVEPERRAGLRRKMPLHDFPHVGIELFLRGFNGCGVGIHFKSSVITMLQQKKIYALGKYLSTVARLGGRVSNEKRIMHSADPKTIGTTVM